MPTDPFVAPDLADRPRQQQNLPPGMAYPPARGWRAGRPGDATAREPHGRLFGAPGPNVGYALTLAERSRDRFRTGEHEHLDDAVAIVAEIAMRRAALFGRAPVIRDVELAMTLLGYDGSADEGFVGVRSHLVRDLSHAYSRRRALVDSVPEELLRLGAADAAARAGEWRRQVPETLARHE